MSEDKSDTSTLSKLAKKVNPFKKSPKGQTQTSKLFRQNEEKKETSLKDTAPESASKSLTDSSEGKPPKQLTSTFSFVETLRSPTGSPIYGLVETPGDGSVKSLLSSLTLEDEIEAKRDRQLRSTENLMTQIHDQLVVKLQSAEDGKSVFRRVTSAFRGCGGYQVVYHFNFLPRVMNEFCRGIVAEGGSYWAFVRQMLCLAIAESSHVDGICQEDVEVAAYAAYRAAVDYANAGMNELKKHFNEWDDLLKVEESEISKHLWFIGNDASFLIPEAPTSKKREQSDNTRSTFTPSAVYTKTKLPSSSEWRIVSEVNSGDHVVVEYMRISAGELKRQPSMHEYVWQSWKQWLIYQQVKTRYQFCWQYVFHFSHWSMSSSFCEHKNLIFCLGVHLRSYFLSLK